MSRGAGKSSPVLRLGRSVGGAEFVLERFGVGNGEAATVNFEHALGLKAGEVARNQFAHGADLRGQFLIAGGQFDFHTVGSARAFLRQAQKERSGAVADGGERELFDNAYQPAQASA